MPNSIRTIPATQARFTAGNSVLAPSLGKGVYTLAPNGQSTSRLIIRNGEKAHAYHLDGRVFHDSPLPSIFHDTPANRAAIATLYGLKIVDSIERLSNDPVQNSVHSNVELCSNNREENHLEAKDYRTVEQRFSGISGFCPFTGELTDSTERLAEHTERMAPFSKIDHSQNNREESAPSSTEHRTTGQHFSGFSESCSPTLKVVDSPDHDINEAILLPTFSPASLACDLEAAGEALSDIGQLLYLIQRGSLSISAIESLARLAHHSSDTWADILYTQSDKLNKSLEQTEFAKVED